jgi:phage tail sheath protein FI
MAEYLSPGVYIEEVDAGPKPIEGVSTSTAGAVGVTARGPTDGKPELVTSFAEFVRKFGSFLSLPAAAVQAAWEANAIEGGRWWHFPLSVKGFFDNGGQRLFVKRVISRNATAASARLWRGLVAEVERDAAATGAPAELTVRHLFGIQVGTAVTLRNGATGQTIGGPFLVAAYDSTARRITLDQPLPAATPVQAARGDTVEITTPVAVPAPAVPFVARAKARGGWSNDLRVRARPSLGATLTLLPDPVNGGAAARAQVAALAPPAAAGNPWLVTVQPSAAGPASLADFADGDHVVIAGREVTIQNVQAPANTFEIAVLPAGTNWAPGTPVQRLRPAHQGPVDQLRMWGASSLYDGAVLELDNGIEKEERQVGAVVGDLVTLVGGNLARNYYEGQRVRVVEVEVSAQYLPGGKLEAEETFTNLRLVGRAGDPAHIVTRLAQDSKLIEIDDGGAAQPIALASMPVARDGRWQSLRGGDDDEGGLDVDDFVGEDGGSGNRTGIQALEDIDEISICVVPGMWSLTVHNGLIQHCETLKDRFAIIDPRSPLDIEGVRSFREAFDTKYAALYHPWIEVRDPSTQQNVVVGPSAHMAGLYARVDVERGVHKAPGNEVIRGITRIAQDVTKREQDLLNPRNINALRFFPGRGNRVWGARVLTSDASWKYINVRRLFIFVEESIDEGTQWVVFEPNDEPTWARVRQSVANFLTTVWRSGALQGAKAEEAFFVRCDRTTMSQDDIDNGRLICVIGIAPVKPAEFVIFRIQQKTLEQQAR